MEPPRPHPPQASGLDFAQARVPYAPISRGVPRRTFLKALGPLALGVSLFGGCVPRAGHRLAARPPLGPLQQKGDRVLELPEGFSYLLAMDTGARMADGLATPAVHTAIGASKAADGTLLVVRNHGVEAGSPSRFGPFGFQNAEFDARRHPVYDAGPDAAKPAYGAVTWFRYDPARKWTVDSGLVLGGLLSVTGGSWMPGGTWLCAEGVVRGPDERYAKPHGYAFTCTVSAALATDRVGAVEPVYAMGHFARGGLAVDAPRTGAPAVVYQTEAHPEGLFYRYLAERPDALAAGGRLQALALEDPASAGDLASDPGARRVPVRWVDVPPTAPRDAGAEQGALPFAFGAEVALWAGSVYFATRGSGADVPGRLWRYTPGTAKRSSGAAGHLEPVRPPASPAVGGMAPLTRAPWGDLLCTGMDPAGRPTLYGVPPHAAPYPLARNVFSQTPFAGAAFSPDHDLLFLTLGDSGLTVAVFGPWGPVS